MNTFLLRTDDFQIVINVFLFILGRDVLTCLFGQTSTSYYYSIYMHHDAEYAVRVFFMQH